MKSAEFACAAEVACAADIAVKCEVLPIDPKHECYALAKSAHDLLAAKGFRVVSKEEREFAMGGKVEGLNVLAKFIAKRNVVGCELVVDDYDVVASEKRAKMGKTVHCSSLFAVVDFHFLWKLAVEDFYGVVAKLGENEEKSKDCKAIEECMEIEICKAIEKTKEIEQKSEEIDQASPVYHSKSPTQASLPLVRSLSGSASAPQQRNGRTMTDLVASSLSLPYSLSLFDEFCLKLSSQGYKLDQSSTSVDATVYVLEKNGKVAKVTMIKGDGSLHCRFTLDGEHILVRTCKCLSDLADGLSKLRRGLTGDLRELWGEVKEYMAKTKFVVLDDGEACHYSHEYEDGEMIVTIYFSEDNVIHGTMWNDCEEGKLDEHFDVWCLSDLVELLLKYCPRWVIASEADMPDAGNACEVCEVSEACEVCEASKVSEPKPVDVGDLWKELVEHLNATKSVACRYRVSEADYIATFTYQTGAGKHEGDVMLRKNPGHVYCCFVKNGKVDREVECKSFGGDFLPVWEEFCEGFSGFATPCLSANSVAQIKKSSLYENISELMEKSKWSQCDVQTCGDCLTVEYKFEQLDGRCKPAVIGSVIISFFCHRVICQYKVNGQKYDVSECKSIDEYEYFFDMFLAHLRDVADKTEAVTVDQTKADLKDHKNTKSDAFGGDMPVVRTLSFDDDKPALAATGCSLSVASGPKSSSSHPVFPRNLQVLGDTKRVYNSLGYPRDSERSPDQPESPPVFFVEGSFDAVDLFDTTVEGGIKKVKACHECSLFWGDDLSEYTLENLMPALKPSSMSSLWDNGRLTDSMLRAMCSVYKPDEQDDVVLSVNLVDKEFDEDGWTDLANYRCMGFDDEGKLKPSDDCKDILSASAAYFVSDKLALLVWPGKLAVVVPRADVLTNFARCGVSCNVLLNVDRSKVEDYGGMFMDNSITPHEYHNLMLEARMTSAAYGGKLITSLGTPCSEALFKLACCVYAVKDEHCDGCLPNKKGTGVDRSQIVKNMLAADAPKKVKQSTGDAKFFDKVAWDGLDGVPGSGMKESCMTYAMISKLASARSGSPTVLDYVERMADYLLAFFGVPSTHVYFCECVPEGGKFVDKEWGCGLSVDSLASALNTQISSGPLGVLSVMKYFEGMQTYGDDVELPPGKNLFGRCLLKAYRHMRLKMSDCPHPAWKSMDRRDWFSESKGLLTGIQRYPLFFVDVNARDVVNDLVSLNESFERFLSHFEYAEPESEEDPKAARYFFGSPVYQTPVKTVSVASKKERAVSLAAEKERAVSLAAEKERAVSLAAEKECEGVRKRVKRLGEFKNIGKDAKRAKSSSSSDSEPESPKDDLQFEMDSESQIVIPDRESQIVIPDSEDEVEDLGFSLSHKDFLESIRIFAKHGERASLQGQAMDLIARFAEKENKEKPQAVVQAGCVVHRLDRGECELFYKFFVDPSALRAISRGLHKLSDEFAVVHSDGSLLDRFHFVLVKP